MGTNGKLQDKVSIVPGAASGIDEASAKRFAAEDPVPARHRRHSPGTPGA